MSVDFLTMVILVLVVGISIYYIDDWIENRRTKKDKMPWYYWFIGIVIYAIIETTIDRSDIIRVIESRIEPTPDNALLFSIIFSVIMTIIYAILAFGLPSFIWKLRLKSKQKKSENTNAEKQERRYKQ
ncbi:MAG: hypothetical protein ACOX6Y_08140 [Christensenellales bacterium]|jgi:quinol-cytochrome oxidoreductase complex cytochrome b subunit